VSKKKSLLLRLDPKVHAAIQKWAADELRSVNAQIEYILRQALIKAGRADSLDEGDNEQEGLITLQVEGGCRVPRYPLCLQETGGSAEKVSNRIES